jgi:hypothetical protein
MSHIVFSILGSTILVSWPVFIAMSFADTNTQGAIDSWLISAVVCSVSAVIAAFLLWISRKVKGPAVWGRVIVPLLAFVPLFLTIQHAYDSVILGDHLCGREFNEIAADAFFCRFYYLWLWFLAATVSVIALLPGIKSIKEPDLFS